MPTAPLWPQLRYDEWKDTLSTLHRWTQVVGKIRLVRAPMQNHWWHVTLYVTPRGLTTSTMFAGDGRAFEIAFDFVEDVLTIAVSDGQRASVALAAMSVAEFFERLMRELRALHIEARIDPHPNELPDTTRLDRDTEHATYDPRAAERFWRILLQANRLCAAFRAEFIGKSSPVHFFWGSFDLAVSLFSGRRAPPHPGGFPNLPDRAVQEAYSHEEFTAGFWPGQPGLDASFYTYIYPEPPGFAQARVRPEAAAWSALLREFVLPYEAVRTSPDPERAVLDFFSSTYAAAANLARWDRAALERRTATVAD